MLINKRKTSGILFDFDNTLVKTEALAAKALDEVLARINVSLTQQETEWMAGRSWPDIFEHIFVPRKLPISSNELISEVLTIKEKMLKKNIPTLPGAFQAVNKLSKTFPVGLVSGSFQNEITPILQAINLDKIFKTTVSAEDVKRGKPFPDPYLLGAKQLGISPEEIVVFEDSRPGLISAQAAGAKCVIVLAGASANIDLTGADLIIDNLLCVNADFINKNF